uniref:Uncharacterized protein n=1 Tax=Oryza nivara TaxID=4536 RepID=A0A0E0I1F5_ORYNI
MPIASPASPTATSRSSSISTTTPNTSASSSIPSRIYNIKEALLTVSHDGYFPEMDEFVRDRRAATASG